MSESEPELGLGLVRGVRLGKVKLWFPAAEESRVYAWPGAPLVRVEFAQGDTITWPGGIGRVSDITVRENVLTYLCDGQTISEDQLSGTLSRRGPLDRLGAGKLDENEAFEVRREALFRRAKVQRSPVRGFAGARMELIPHQLGIAADVSGRLRPRVLLADEVGLGKTIEACLILHRLHLTGRADRVLILVPEPLIHQWFVELLRRFNLHFSIFDEERCAAIGDGPEGDGLNPFLDSQLVLCPLSLLTGEALRARQAVAAGWDLLLVDEAHRLSGTGADGSGGSLVVERLAEAVPGVLLLSGTPHQAGPEGHFARLRLLDPARYHSYAAFCQETAGYGDLADQIAALAAGREDQREARIAALLDRCGIGRVMFRHGRAALGGFPARELHPAPLADTAESTRVVWLAALLRRPGEEKLLLICHERERAEALKEALLQHIEIKVGVFHEGLTLLQRDRQAAWFSEEDGARILLCSEIGSEGRNFQFARHLVLWDLPEDPELLEQRIGRLDRIGQKGTIYLHVPYALGTAEEVLLRWYADGLGAFAGPVSGTSQMAAAIAPLLHTVMADPSPEKIERLIQETLTVKQSVGDQLAHGYDRLLQWQSAGTGLAVAIQAQIQLADADEAQERFWIRLLEFLGMQVEALRPRRWMFQAGSPETESLPSMTREGFSGTFDRRDALEREEIAFLTDDHPLLLGALDLLLGSSKGTASCAVLTNSPQPGLLLEICYVLECIAPAALQADRFLPSLPLRIVVDHQHRDRSEDPVLLQARAATADRATTETARAAVASLKLAHAAASFAEPRQAKAIASALKKMHRTLDGELERLQALAARHGHVSQEEIAELQAQQSALHLAISSARLRVDSVRIAVLR